MQLFPEKKKNITSSINSLYINTLHIQLDEEDRTFKTERNPFSSDFNLPKEKRTVVVDGY